MTSVLALPGTFTMGVKSLTNANFNETLNLLLESKARTTALSTKDVDLAGYYIKVTCNLNAHVTKTLAGNNTDPAGETNVDDDMFEFEALKVSQSDFSDTLSISNNYPSNATEAGTGDHRWDSANAVAEYRLKKFSKEVELGRVTLDSTGVPSASITGTTQWAVKQTFENEALGQGDNANFSAKNLLVMPEPSVSEETGTGNLLASIAEDVTVAQYLHVTATGSTAGEVAKGTQHSAFDNDSKYDTDGNTNSWISTTGDSNIDKLEDKLGINISKDNIAAAYADEIAAIVSAGHGQASKKIIEDWEVNIARIGGPSSLFSKHARAVYNGRNGGADGTGNLFAAGDMIVVVGNNGEPITKDLNLTINDYNGDEQTLVSHSGDDALRFLLAQSA